MRDFVPFLFACSGLRCNTSREYQNTQLIHFVCMSVSLKTVYFGFKPNLYIYIVIYLCYIYTFTSIINIVLLIILYCYLIIILLHTCQGLKCAGVRYSSVWSEIRPLGVRRTSIHQTKCPPQQMQLSSLYNNNSSTSQSLII